MYAFSSFSWYKSLNDACMPYISKILLKIKSFLLFLANGRAWWGLISMILWSYKVETLSSRMAGLFVQLSPWWPLAMVLVWKRLYSSPHSLSPGLNQCLLKIKRNYGVLDSLFYRWLENTGSGPATETSAWVTFGVPVFLLASIIDGSILLQEKVKYQQMNWTRYLVGSMNPGHEPPKMMVTSLVFPNVRPVSLYRMPTEVVPVS